MHHSLDIDWKPGCSVYFFKRFRLQSEPRTGGLSNKEHRTLGNRKDRDMKTITWGQTHVKCVRPLVTTPVGVQPPDGRRIVLSLNGGFLECAVTYIYSISVSPFGRLEESCIPGLKVWLVVISVSDRLGAPIAFARATSLLISIGQRCPDHGA